MKTKFNVTLLSALSLLLADCSTSVNIESRQYDQLVSGTALSSDQEEINFNIKGYYVFQSRKEPLFDEKGYFVDSEKEARMLILAKTHIISSIRNFASEYNATVIDTMDNKTIEREILKAANSIKANEDVEIVFRHFLSYPWSKKSRSVESENEYLLKEVKRLRNELHVCATRLKASERTGKMVGEASN